MRRRLSIVGLLAAISLLGSVASRAAASTTDLAAVRAARVTQDGRQLRWTLTFVHNLSRHELVAQTRGACLLIEQPHSQGVTRSVCLSIRARGLALTQALWRDGAVSAARPLAGTVARSGADRITAGFTPVALGIPYRSLRWQVLSTAAGHGCVAAPRTHHAACAVFFPARHRPLAALHTPVLAGCVARGPSLVDSGPTRSREIALTFDDGPWWDPPPMEFVDELKRLGAVGTFFEIGQQLGPYDPTGSVQRAMLADGDMIGDHTWTHPDMDALAPAAQASELERTADAIRAMTGFTPCLWRPPYGTADSSLVSLARGLGFLTIDWNDDTRDWSLPGTGSIVSTALAEARPGGIIIMHFGGGPRQQTLAALPQIVRTLRARGYRFVNVAQLLGLREIWR